MKKIVLFIALAVAMTFSLSAGKASALTMASSVVKGGFDLETLTIETTGSLVYSGTESMTEAYADTVDDFGGLIIDGPYQDTIFDWTSLNENSAGVPGAYYAESVFDPVYLDFSTDFDPASRMFAHAEAYADDAGNDGYGDAWTELTGIINGGASGGNITISVDYSMSITLDTSLGYQADGYSLLELELHGQGLSDDEDISDLYMDVFDGVDGFDTVFGTLSVTLYFDAFESGDFHLDLFSDAYAGPMDAVVPEPSTYILLGTGIAGLIVWRRKRSMREGKS